MNKNSDEYKQKMTTIAIILAKGFSSCYGTTIKDFNALQTYLFELLCDDKLEKIEDVALQLEKRQRKEKNNE